MSPRRSKVEYSSPQRVLEEFRKLENPVQAAALKRFFKTGQGGYGEGDRFLGVKVPQTRSLLRKLPVDLNGALELLTSEWHEVRLFAVLAMADLAQRADDSEQAVICKKYLEHSKFINNWDLVDSSAQSVVGPVLCVKKPEALDRLARSHLLWDRRIAMIATAYAIRQGDSRDALRVATLLLDDRHDLIHKAVGWMLREVGQRCGRPILVSFLEAHASHMPRTALRYAIEHFPQTERKRWLAVKKEA